MADGGRSALFDTVEGRRLRGQGEADWRRWGPYLAERQWGTVREDYSADGDAWVSFPHDHARSRAYRWGEDGIAGFCDEGQTWCLSLGLWNGADPIVKERLFGLTNAEGNHGEDVKELWWHLDAVPSHAWQSMLYRYPQRRFPYEDLVPRTAGVGVRPRPNTNSRTPASCRTTASSTCRWITPKPPPTTSSCV